MRMTNLIIIMLVTNYYKINIRTSFLLPCLTIVRMKLKVKYITNINYYNITIF